MVLWNRWKVLFLFRTLFSVSFFFSWSSARRNPHSCCQDWHWPFSIFSDCLRQQQGGIRSVRSCLGAERMQCDRDAMWSCVCYVKISQTEKGKRFARSFHFLQIRLKHIRIVFTGDNFGLRHSLCAKPWTMPLLIRLRRAGFSRAAATRSLSASLEPTKCRNQ